MNLKEIKEGKVKLFIPDVKRPEKGDVFYNPEMEVDRNITVSILNIIGKKDLKLCDCLGASGVRGIRYLKETPVKGVWINDANPKAVEVIEKNLKKNGLDLEVRNMDANILLRKEKFDFVDIDPFGSPAPFLDSAARSFIKKGCLALTATDTAPLSGTYPRVSWRRYGIKSLKTTFFKELGLRILISSVIKTFSKYDKSFIPKFSYARRHYFRVFGRIEKGTKKTNELMENFGFVSYCFTCDWRDSIYRERCPNCNEKLKHCGEIYLGKIHEKEFCRKVWKDYVSRFREKIGGKILRTLSEENYNPFYYDTHSIAKKTNIEIPKLKELIEKTRNEGYEISRTQLCETGVRTDTPYKSLIEILKNQNEMLPN